MPKFKIQHITKYTYEVPVRDSANQVMLYPVEDESQQLIFQKLRITGDPLVETHFDYFNNKTGTFTHSHPHQELVIDSVLEVVTKGSAPASVEVTMEDQWNELKKVRSLIPYIDLLRVENFRAIDELKPFITTVCADNHEPLECAKIFCDYVFSNFVYKKGITTVDTTLDEIWKIRSGVCQDFAHILLAMLRLVNIPARYVSGYICPNKNGMRGEGATHAWVEAYMPFRGWVGLDPTNNCVVDQNHVRLAVGKNFYDCSPVRGTYRGTSNHTLEVSVSVSYEDGNTSGLGQHQKEEVITSVSRNSYRKHQDQMQQ